MPKGTIRRLMADRGYDFIRTEGREDIFFHRSELQGVDYSSLREGQQVEFDLGKGRDGRTVAVQGEASSTQGLAVLSRASGFGDGNYLIMGGKVRKW